MKGDANNVKVKKEKTSIFKFPGAISVRTPHIRYDRFKAIWSEKDLFS